MLNSCFTRGGCGIYERTTGGGQRKYLFFPVASIVTKDFPLYIVLIYNKKVGTFLFCSFEREAHTSDSCRQCRPDTERTTLT